MRNSLEGQVEQSSAAHAPETSDELIFLREWLRKPFFTAAMLPSGKTLSLAMAAAVDPAVPGVFVELGAGTGSITAALVERGVLPERLILIEFLPVFCDVLRRRYPTAHVIVGDAFDAPSLLRSLNIEPLAGIVSSLPLYSRKPEHRQRLMQELLQFGPPGIPFVQATNFAPSPIPFNPALIKGSRSRRIWTNSFPALVWTYRRSQVLGADSDRADLDLIAT